MYFVGTFKVVLHVKLKSKARKNINVLVYFVYSVNKSQSLMFRLCPVCRDLELKIENHFIQI